ncbi:MAG TPA: nucleotidyl transferase AbiEii/AbiGii toxin family protein [Flavisolibacter sp.]|nr:nucleotidyl transferase AbiEii/AbiGii toxin family protein [Flavisolibacter sp.]
MIPQAYITEWRNRAPWPENYQVEQDLVIERALVEIYTDPFLKERLAFRKGTALHKLHLSPQVRYSEDIDLVQINAEPFGSIIGKLRERLAWLGRPVIKQKQHNNTMVFRFESEDGIPVKLKVETNCREHFTVLGIREITLKVESRWFTGEAGIPTYDIHELLGTKLRALYQRKKGRDLFDL